MDLQTVRSRCMSFAGVTETVQFGNNLVFKVCGKMFAVVALEADDNVIAFKCSHEDFAELTEMEDIIPAPYLARAQWVALKSFDALPPAQMKEQLRRAYDVVVAKLPRKLRASL